MTSLAVLGATGNLGGYVAREGVARGLDLSVVVRSPSRLSPDIATRARVTIGDLAQMPLDEIARFASGHDALICCAGLVSDGEKFVALADRVVCALETLAADKRPVAWFMAGAALLDFDARGRRGVDLPKVRNTYWPHSRNFARLGRSDLDWRLLCPGPMVEQSGLGAERLRVSFGSLPAPLSPIARYLPGPLVLPLFAMKVPEMIVSYADAAAVMLNNLAAGSPMSKQRVGLALPIGMRGRKNTWAARSRAST